jgi:ribosomal protein S18 acetylase RimI-like enzyme
MIKNDYQLDNPVWYSLVESHCDFSLNYDNLKCYHPDYCPFGGFEENKDISKSIDDYAKKTSNFFIVGGKPKLPISLEMKKELICSQMVIHDKINLNIHEEITALNNTHEVDLFELVNLVQPGYFKMKTASLGDYFGIYKDGELVAVAGERMKMNNYTEVSAIVTHPLHIGQGYAKQLITHTVNNIFTQNKMPYLHVVESNINAIALYEKLGFVQRRKISFWNISEKEPLKL